MTRWPVTAGAVVAGVMVGSTAGARAQEPIPSGGLYTLCSLPESDPLSARCLGYVLAISEVMRGDGPGVYGLKYCAQRQRPR
jgi:hypothetical protein